MLEKTKYIKFKNKLPSAFDAENNPPFNVKIPIDRSWDKSKKRILIVAEHVDSSDIKSGKLFDPNNESHSQLRNIFRYAKKFAKEHKGKNTLKGAAFASINFNYFKTYELNGADRVHADQLSASRVNAFIEKYEPTHIIVFGDTAAMALIEPPNDVDVRQFRGRKLDIEGIPCISTLDFSSLYKIYGSKGDEDVDENSDDKLISKGNLIGYTGYNLASVYNNFNPLYSIDVKPKAVFIDTIKKLKKLIAKLETKDAVALDIECDNLNHHNNNILTIQLSWTKDVSYIIPIAHKDTPIQLSTTEARMLVKKYISRDFSKIRMDKRPFFIGTNLAFDTKILRKFFDIELIWYSLWSVDAAEYAFDENKKALVFFGTPCWNLAHITRSYGCDFYDTAEVSKDDRHRLGEMDLDKKVLDYGAADSQIPYAIYEQQVLRSKRTKFGRTSYAKAFNKFMRTVISSIEHVQSTKTSRGTKLDAVELQRLLSKTSPVKLRIAEINKELRAFKSVKKANSIIIKDNKIPRTSLFGNTADLLWKFDLGKAAHKQILFIEVLKLETVNIGALDKPKFDKDFQKLHKEVPEVLLLSELGRLNTLMSTYIKPFALKLKEDPDASIDHMLRPRFGFKDILTGRSNSFSPSLQNIPEHSSEAKYIKRCFIAMLGSRKTKVDFSAHEIRCWGIMAEDNKVAQAFKSCMEYLYKFRRNPTKKNKADFESSGDIHKINYSFFTNVPIKEIQPDQRQISKNIVFGSIYGRSVASVARVIEKTVADTKKLVKAFFKSFKKASDWLDFAKVFSKDNLYIFSQLGRVRHLPAYILNNSTLTAALERRSMNSPIQGFASDIGYLSARLYTEKAYIFCRSLDIKETCYSPMGIDVMVHDSIESTAEKELWIASIHMLEWAMCHGVRDFLLDVYNFDTGIDFAVDFNLGMYNSKLNSWNFNPKTLKNVIYQSSKDAVELGEDNDPKTDTKFIIKSYKEQLPWLKLNCPIKFDLTN